MQSSFEDALDDDEEDDDEDDDDDDDDDMEETSESRETSLELSDERGSSLERSALWNQPWKLAACLERRDPPRQVD